MVRLLAKDIKPWFSWASQDPKYREDSCIDPFLIWLSAQNDGQSLIKLQQKIVFDRQEIIPDDLLL